MKDTYNKGRIRTENQNESKEIMNKNSIMKNIK